MERKKPSADIIQTITEQIDEMSESQRQIALFILSNPATLGLISITELSKRTGVSSATIIRFFRKLGYRGFKDFSRDMQQNIQADFSAALRFALDRDHTRQNAGENNPTAMTNVLETGVQNMLDTIELYTQDDVSECVNMMTKADNIYLLGGLIAEPLVYLFRYLLGKVTKKVFLFDGSSLFGATTMSHISKNTLVFVIAYPRYCKKTILLAKLARERGCKLVLLTNNKISPLSACADIIFPIPVSTISFVDIFSAPTTFLSGLTVEYSRHNSQESNDNLVTFDHVASTVGLYYNESDNKKYS